MPVNKKSLVEKLKTQFGKPKDDYFDFEKIRQYFDHKDQGNAFQVLSERTFEDLDFEELFRFLDRTSSRIGQQYLYDRLRVIHRQPDLEKEQENLAEKFLQDEDLRVEIQSVLSKLNNPNAYYLTALFQEEHIRPPDWFLAVKLLSAAGFVSLLLFPFFPPVLFIFLGVFLVNLIIHYWNKRFLHQYAGSVPQLLKLNRAVKDLNRYSDIFKKDTDLEESVKAIDKTRNRMSFFRLEAQLDSDFASLAWSLLELVKIAFLLEPLVLYNILKHLDETRGHIHRLFRFIGEADLAVSIASLRDGLPYYCLPVFLPAGKSLKMDELYHPLVADCIPNSIELNGRSVLITGSNMSGKTTFIRTIGVNTIMAYGLNTCCARQFEIPETRLFSAIRISDDLMNDKSYYFSEVLTIKEMLDNADNGKYNLFLLDEIYKGTNTIERIAAGKAVLSKLNRNQNFVFVSTHDIELSDLLANEYDLYNFSERVEDNSIGFDYKLKPGKLKNKNAISILELNGYPQDLVGEARELADRMEKINARNQLNGEDR